VDAFPWELVTRKRNAERSRRACEAWVVGGVSILSSSRVDEDKPGGPPGGRSRPRKRVGREPESDGLPCSWGVVAVRKILRPGSCYSSRSR